MTTKRNITQEASTVQTSPAPNFGGFDLFRVSRSKDIVDVCPNTMRAYFKVGLPFYKKGKAIFVSKIEFEAFIRNPEPAQKPAKRSR